MSGNNRSISWVKLLHTCRSFPILCHIFLILVASSAITHGYAQSAEDLGNQQIYVVKAYEPVISDANKINLNPEVIEWDQKKTPVKYQLIPKTVISQITLEPIVPAKLKGEPLVKLNNSYVKAGFGNYTTPYAEAFYSSPRSKDYVYSFQGRHFSSAGGLKKVGKSSFNENRISGSGMKFYENQTISGEIYYERNKTNFYGFIPGITLSEEIKNTPSQFFSEKGLNFSMITDYKDSSLISHREDIRYYHLSDKFKNVENGVDIKIDLGKYMNKELFKLPIGFQYFYNSSDTTTSSYTLISSLNPNVVSSGKIWRLKAGLNVSILSQNKGSGFHFFPDVDFQYNPADNLIIPYAGINGKIFQNSVRILSSENPFIMGNQYGSGKINYNGYLGIKSNLSRNVSINLKGYTSKIENMAFFMNNVPASGFYAAYDTVKIFGLLAEGIWSPIEKWSASGSFGYNYYELNNFSFAWNKPSTFGDLFIRYNLKDKIMIGAQLYYFGERKGIEYHNDPSKNNVGLEPGNPLAYSSTVTLKPFVDASLNFEYRYSKALSGFLNINNLAGTRYYRWMYYPSQRINLLAGISYSF